MDQSGIKLDWITFETFLSKMFACKRYDLIYEILQAMVSKGLQVRPKDFNIVICGLCKESKLAEADQLVQIMSKQGVQLDHYSYGCLIKALCVTGNLENLEKAWDVHREMTAQGIETTPHIATQFLQGLDKLGLNNYILWFFVKFEELGVVPDRVLYNYAINAYCRLGRLKEAIELIKEMRNNGLDPDRKHYTCLIKGFHDMEDTVNAQVVFAEMLNSGLKPDTVSYNVLLNALFSNGLIDKASALLGQMMVLKTCRSETTRERRKSEIKAEVLKLTSCMRKDGVKLDLVGYTTLIDGECKLGNMNAAQKLFEAMVEIDGLKPNVQVYTVLIGGYCNQGRIEKAWELFQKMVDSDIKPDSIVRLVMKKGVARANKMRNKESMDSF
ncbi:hypothetical protein LUZ61_020533 [Rhynchospora tenuis]|uniref:Pentatricopeptide repeat-containing protein n=1 Tax=Rhynchospora tenuis TaxID=198213 RepID=A0AAD6ENW7_9POAL|nr:hypothetical protein LUZ61_020533 [Rhynchospora tenuis]